MTTSDKQVGATAGSAETARTLDGDPSDPSGPPADRRSPPAEDPEPSPAPASGRDDASNQGDAGSQDDAGSAPEPSGEAPAGEGERTPRTLQGRPALAVAVIAFLFACYQIGHGVGWIHTSTPIQHRAIHVWFGLVLIYLCYAASRRRRGHRPTVTDLLAVLGITAACAYIIPSAPDILAGGGAFAPGAALYFGVLLAVLALEAARRVLGWAMPLLVVVVVGYALGGDLLPGMFGIRGFDFDSVVNDLYYSDRGLFGPLVGLSGGVIAAFLIFGAVLYRTGGGETFVQIARLATGGARGGPAKVSTVSSALFGIASGSAVANVIVDGVFNIPLMRKSGYSKRMAGAVEAVASSGGQLVPPFMGAAAFVLAEFVRIPYATVALAAIIPALLYYVALFVAIHLHAVRHGIAGTPRHLLPGLRALLPDLLRLLAPLALLIWLIVAGYSPERSVLYALGVVIGIHLVHGLLARAGTRNLVDVVHGLVDGGRSVAVLAVLIIVASIVVREIDLTALGVKLSSSISGIAESSLGAALLVAMVTTVVLGMGVPTTAAYVIAAAVVVPAVVQAGVDPLAANMFVLYFAVMSAITPPVCPAVFAAASLARTNWTGVAWEAVRLSLPAYLVPFLFVLSPSLLLLGSPGETVYRLAVSVIGVSALAAALVGYLFGPLVAWRRLVLLGAGLLVIYPAPWADACGLAITAAVTVSGWLRWRAERATRVVTP